MKTVINQVIAAIALSFPLLGHAASVDLSVSPTPQAVIGLNQTFTVDIVGNYRSDAGEVLVGGAIDLLFDASIVQVNSAILHTPVDLGSSPGTIDNLGGNLDALGFATFAGVGDGMFNFATVEFETVGFGTSALALQDANDLVFEWANGIGDAVAFSATDGSVTVSAVPLPAAAWMMLSALIGIAGIARKTPAAA
jgi:hypothetical protein